MKKALIVIDLIEDYFDARIWPKSRIPERRTHLINRTNLLATACRAGGVPVIWFRQQFEPDLSDAFPHMIESGKRYAIRDTRGAQLLEELWVDPDDTVLVKNRYSAFFHTRLESILQEYDVDDLVLAGITTAWCVRSTAVDGYQRGYGIQVATDATAGFTEEEHEESIRAMGSVIARCMPVAQIIEELGGRSSH